MNTFCEEKPSFYKLFLRFCYESTAFQQEQNLKKKPLMGVGFLASPNRRRKNKKREEKHELLKRPAVFLAFLRK